MTKRPLLLSFLLFISTPVIVLASPQNDRQNVPAVQSSLKAIHIQAVGIENVVKVLAAESKIVVGVEDSTNVEPTNFDVALGPGTLAQALDAIVARAPGYAWRTDSDGAIHVYPVRSSVSLASIKIRSFRVYDYTRLELWNSLDKLPEVQDWLRENGCTRRELMAGYEFKDDEKNIWLDGSGQTLGEILDKAASQSGVYSWSISQSRINGRCTIGIRLW